jgi:hypothetical protein
MHTCYYVDLNSSNFLNKKVANLTFEEYHYWSENISNLDREIAVLLIRTRYHPESCEYKLIQLIPQEIRDLYLDATVEQVLEYNKRQDVIDYITIFNHNRAKIHNIETLIMCVQKTINFFYILRPLLIEISHCFTTEQLEDIYDIFNKKTYDTELIFRLFNLLDAVPQWAALCDIIFTDFKCNYSDFNQVNSRITNYIKTGTSFDLPESPLYPKIYGLLLSADEILNDTLQHHTQPTN